MKGLHGEHWYGETGKRTRSKTPSKPQSTQQHKPTWWVECNCPTCRSWQSDKAVTPVLRRTWLKTNEGQREQPTKKSEGNRPRTEPWEEKKIYLVAPQKNRTPMYQSESSAKLNQWNGTKSDAVPVEPNTTKKKAPPNRTQQG